MAKIVTATAPTPNLNASLPYAYDNAWTITTAIPGPAIWGAGPAPWVTFQLDAQYR